MLDKLIDPERRYPRLYRQHCIRTREGIYIKDLRVIRNRQLKDIILVDNAVYSFGLQLSNGIPIASFKEDPKDREFIYLIPHLDACAEHDDVRALHARARARLLACT